MYAYDGTLHAITLLIYSSRLRKFSAKLSVHFSLQVNFIKKKTKNNSCRTATNRQAPVGIMVSNREWEMFYKL